MAYIPETEAQHQGVYSIITEACKKPTQVKLADNTIEIQSIIDSRKVWLKTHNINSPHYGRFTFVEEEFKNKSVDAFNHMCFEKANVVSAAIIRKVDSYDYSIDAKSSETVRDAHNNQMSLMHMLTNKNVEKKFTISGEGKKTFLDALAGRQGTQEA